MEVSSLFQLTLCCGYGSDGMKTTAGYDCLTIPGAAKSSANAKALNERFCGRGLVDKTADPFSSMKKDSGFKTICCKYKDF